VTDEEEPWRKSQREHLAQMFQRWDRQHRDVDRQLAHLILSQGYMLEDLEVVYVSGRQDREYFVGLKGTFQGPWRHGTGFIPLREGLSSDEVMTICKDILASDDSSAMPMVPGNGERV